MLRRHNLVVTLPDDVSTANKENAPKMARPKRHALSWNCWKPPPRSSNALLTPGRAYFAEHSRGWPFCWTVEEIHSDRLNMPLETESCQREQCHRGVRGALDSRGRRSWWGGGGDLDDNRSGRAGDRSEWLRSRALELILVDVDIRRVLIFIFINYYTSSLLLLLPCLLP